MLRRIRKFVLQAEDGAVTVDWIVLCASAVGLGFAAFSMIGGDTMSLTARIDQQLSAERVATDPAISATAATGELSR